MDKNVSVAIRINSNVRLEWSRRGIISSHIPANKRVTGMDEQQVLLYLSEFGIPPVRGSLLVCNDLEESEVRSREILPHSKKRKKLEFLRGCEHTTVSKLGLEELDQFYLFIFFSFSLSARIESSLHSSTLGPELLELRNYDGNHSSIRECCTNMSVPSSFPYNLRR